MKSIILSKSSQDYTRKKTKKGKDEFSVLFSEMRKGIKKENGKPMKTRDVAELLDIDYELFRKIVNRRNPAKHRDCIIAIGLVLKSDLGQINKALLINGFGALYKLDDDDEIRFSVLDEDIRDIRDEELIRIIEDQGIEPRSLAQINEALSAKDLQPLHILDKRNKSDNAETPPLFWIAKYDVRTRSDELIYGDHFNSLENEYHPNLYIIDAEMLLFRVKDKKKFLLQADFSNGLYHVSVTDVEMFNSGELKKSIINLDLIESDNEFYNYVLEIKSIINKEFKKRIKCLYDTKNYNQRTSARLIDGKLHVFSETFNYRIPEWNDYCLLDYCDGEYVLYASCNSMFMQKYLSDVDYKKYYGDYDEKYHIVELDDHSGTKNPEHSVRTRAYNRMKKSLKDSVDHMLEQLKKREVIVRNLAYIYEIPSEVLDFYHVSDLFECERNEYGEVIRLQKNEIKIKVDDERVSLSLDDISQGFELGLDQIEEIARYKKLYGDLKKIIK